MSFVIENKVLFRHCDPAGIVFYPRYFEMFNDVVEAFFDEALGLPFGEMHPDRGVPTAGIETQFHAPSRLGDDLEIALACKRLGRTSLDIAITITGADGPRVTSKSTLVFVGPDTRPIPWPDVQRALLERMIG